VKPAPGETSVDDYFYDLDWSVDLVPDDELDDEFVGWVDGEEVYLRVESRRVHSEFVGYGLDGREVWFEG